MTEVDKSPLRETRIFALQQFPVNGKAVKRLAQAGYSWLEANKQTVNALNVFPVPDGDTGTNMTLTMKSAVEEMEKVSEDKADEMLGALAQGALMGARGNSGVILSQVWRGFAVSVQGKSSLTSQDLAAAFVSARDTAYKGVVRPVEGTILTVVKDMAAAAEEGAAAGDDPIMLLRRVLQASKDSVQRTPDLLPILKEAGVVDSGGKGISLLMEGMLRWVEGQQLHTAETQATPISAMNLESSLDAVEEGQDYEVVVDFRPSGDLDLQAFYGELETMGTSIQVGEGDGMYRMHIHVPTDKLYDPINYTMGLGTVTNVAIENLMAQMDEITGKAAEAAIKLNPVEPGQIALVVVAPGAGFARQFAELGAAAIVEGGQTMNPSTADLLAAFENLPTDKVIILPNNKNILMAAKAATEVTVKKAVVVPSRSLPEGLAAVLRHNPDGDVEAVARQMEEAMAEVQTGEITTASRNAEIDGVKVKIGEIIGLHNGKLTVSNGDLDNACLELLSKMGADKSEILVLFHGEDISPADAANMADKIRATFSDLEVEVQPGGQPHYQFIFSLE
ncbi:MAG: DAK2 domain-containing protein [Anaerolineales bacterium]|nr:DAK2 domain-containing protein [Anaerolineales bacterium]